jgi:predicted Holliday junction resolvase-like endonuclease
MIMIAVIIIIIIITITTTFSVINMLVKQHNGQLQNQHETQLQLTYKQIKHNRTKAKDLKQATKCDDVSAADSTAKENTIPILSSQSYERAD